jgi:hypothetical protein
MSTASNVTLRTDIGRPLYYEELDTNFQELKYVIVESNEHIASTTAHDASDIVYSNANLSASNVEEALNALGVESNEHIASTTAHDASDIVYSNANLSASNVEEALNALGVKNNLSATSDPTVNNDTSEGYAAFSRWVNTSNNEYFLCLDATNGAAVWFKSSLTLDELGTAALVDMGVSASQIRTNTQNETLFLSETDVGSAAFVDMGVNPSQIRTNAENEALFTDETETTKADVGLGSVDNYSRGDYDARYLAIGAKAADSNKLDGVNSTQFLRSDTTDYLTGKLRLRGDIENENNYRDHGVYGDYDSQKTNHIWSMGSQYRVPADGSNFGDLYGLAYKHTDNSTGGAMAGGHQMVWCAGGTPRAAMGDGIWTSGNVTAYSDIRVKTNINVIPEAIAKVKQLSGYTYERTDIKDDMTGEAVKQTGVIAQEVIKVLPEAVTGGPTENDPEGHYSVAYGNMIGLLIESIKEQQTQIDELKRRIG